MSREDAGGPLQRGIGSTMDEREMFIEAMIPHLSLDGLHLDIVRRVAALAIKQDDLSWKMWQAARRTTPDREAIIEECAKVCDEYAADQWSLYKGRAPYNGSEPGRADPDVQGRSDGADVCAERIRALKVTPTSDKGGA
ncbi:hypothetical protein [Burkholderia latens]|uniref:hypothetical protein n=1 Tax=Burkholderia latens TaxID=488446 RepID=UPI001AE14985|nr:hypothetical protein [Burkholderia latens]QTO46913.1 hypothetical protein J8I85_18220 [Burkholderia latens]